MDLKVENDMLSSRVKLVSLALTITSFPRTPPFTTTSIMELERRPMYTSRNTKSISLLDKIDNILIIKGINCFSRNDSMGSFVTAL